MRRAPKKAYLVYWRRPGGRNRKKKCYVQRYRVGPWIEKLADQYCTDVHVLEGELIDVTPEFLPQHYEAIVEARAARRAEWAEGSDFRKALVVDEARAADWLIDHRRVDRVVRVVVDPVATRVLRLRRRS